MDDLANRFVNGENEERHEAVMARSGMNFMLELYPCRSTMKLIQIGAKGEVQPFETG